MGERTIRGDIHVRLKPLHRQLDRKETGIKWDIDRQSRDYPFTTRQFNDRSWGVGSVSRGISELTKTRSQAVDNIHRAPATGHITLIRVGVPESMAGLKPNETYHSTAPILSSPVRDTSRALNISGVDDEMDVDNDTHQMVPFNTVTETERVRIGTEAVHVASEELLAGIRAHLDPSGFLPTGNNSATIIDDFVTLLQYYCALLTSVRQQGDRIERKETELRTFRRDLEYANARITEPEARPPSEAAKISELCASLNTQSTQEVQFRYFWNVRRLRDLCVRSNNVPTMRTVQKMPMMPPLIGCVEKCRERKLSLPVRLVNR